MSESTCIIVMGLPRSGTSALAGVAHYLGVYWGQHFIDHGEMNPRGSFENDDLISRLAEDTGTPTWLKALTVMSQNGYGPYHYILSLKIWQDLRDLAKDHSLWGFKFNRGLLPGLWDVMWPEVAQLASIKLLVPLRSLEASVASICKWHPEVSEELAWQACWMEKQRLQAIVAKADVPCKLIWYNNLVDHTEREVHELAEWLGVPFQQEAVNFITPTLRRCG